MVLEWNYKVLKYHTTKFYTALESILALLTEQYTRHKSFNGVIFGTMCH